MRRAGTVATLYPELDAGSFYTTGQLVSLSPTLFGEPAKQPEEGSEEEVKHSSPTPGREGIETRSASSAEGPYAPLTLAALGLLC